MGVALGSPRRVLTGPATRTYSSNVMSLESIRSTRPTISSRCTTAIAPSRLIIEASGDSCGLGVDAATTVRYVASSCPTPMAVSASATTANTRRGRGIMEVRTPRSGRSGTGLRSSDSRILASSWRSSSITTNRPEARLAREPGSFRRSIRSNRALPRSLGNQHGSNSA